MKKTTLAIAISLIVTSAYAGIAAAAPGGERKDADGNGVVTRAEAQAHATQMFAMMDANKDGKLDSADRAAHQAAMFDRLDSDHNGAISRQEFEAGHPGPGGPGAEGQEGPQMMHRGPGGPGGSGGHHMGMMILHMADADKDGAVTQAEFNSAALAHFDKADTNKDGQLSREERRMAHQQMRDRMGKMRGGQEGHPPPPA